MAAIATDIFQGRVLPNYQYANIILEIVALSLDITIIADRKTDWNKIQRTRIKLKKQKAKGETREREFRDNVAMLKYPLINIPLNSRQSVSPITFLKLPPFLGYRQESHLFRKTFPPRKLSRHKGDYPYKYSNIPKYNEK